MMEEKNKDKSINNSESGDKTKIVKPQKRENAIKPTGNVNNPNSPANTNETDTKLSQKENTIPPINKSNNKNTKNKSVINSNLIGKTVKNRYEIESILGHGGLCDVYLAKDKILESSGSESPYVALKVLQKEFASQPETARMLIRE
ncbi:serine/threonine protein kinase, partial [Vibrio parahaemolyticus]